MDKKKACDIMIEAVIRYAPLNSEIIDAIDSVAELGRELRSESKAA